MTIINNAKELEIKMVKQRIKDILLIVIMICIPILLFFIWQYLYQLIDVVGIIKHIDEAIKGLFEGLCVDNDVCIMIIGLLLIDKIPQMILLFLLIFIPMVIHLFTILFVDIYFDNKIFGRWGKEASLFIFMTILFSVSVVLMVFNL